MERNTSNQRPGCVGAWLWLAVVMNLVSAIVYIVMMFGDMSRQLTAGIGVQAMLCILNVLACILLFRWIKNGFYLFVACSVTTAVIGIALIGTAPAAAIGAALSVLIWWAVLQAKKDGVSAWSRLKGGWDWKHCRHLYQVFIVACLLVVGLMFVAMPWGTKAEESEYTSFEDTLALEADSTTAEVAESDSIQWETFSDAGGTCSVEAPGHFTKQKSEGIQVLGLAGINDNEPAVFVMRERRADVEALGIKSAEDYASAIMNGYGKVSFTGSEKYPGGAYLVKFTIKQGDSTIACYVLATSTADYYYYCLVNCFLVYDTQQKGTINHILKSFKVN